MTRTTEDLCQDCWQNEHPTEYAPDTFSRWGQCARCADWAYRIRTPTVATDGIGDIVGRRVSLREGDGIITDWDASGVTVRLDDEAGHITVSHGRIAHEVDW